MLPIPLFGCGFDPAVHFLHRLAVIIIQKHSLAIDSSVSSPRAGVAEQYACSVYFDAIDQLPLLTEKVFLICRREYHHVTRLRLCVAFGLVILCSRIAIPSGVDHSQAKLDTMCSFVPLVIKPDDDVVTFIAVNLGTGYGCENWTRRGCRIFPLRDCLCNPKQCQQRYCCDYLWKNHFSIDFLTSIRQSDAVLS